MRIDAEDKKNNTLKEYKPYVPVMTSGVSAITSDCDISYRRIV